MACNTRRYAGNVVGLPMIVRMGGNDTTVPPVNLVRPECGYSVVCGSVCVARCGALCMAMRLWVDACASCVSDSDASAFPSSYVLRDWWTSTVATSAGLQSGQSRCLRCQESHIGYECFHC